MFLIFKCKVRFNGFIEGCVRKSVCTCAKLIHIFGSLCTVCVCVSSFSQAIHERKERQLLATQAIEQGSMDFKQFMATFGTQTKAGVCPLCVLALTAWHLGYGCGTLFPVIPDFPASEMDLFGVVKRLPDRDRRVCFAFEGRGNSLQEASLLRQDGVAEEWTLLENFWRKYNKVLLDNAAITQEKYHPGGRCQAAAEPCIPVDPVQPIAPASGGGGGSDFKAPLLVRVVPQGTQ